jgi:hypothetical protein
LQYSPTKWFLSNIMNGSKNDAANKMNLDGVKWDTMILNGADENALIVDLSAFVSFVTADRLMKHTDALQGFGVPLKQALTISRNLNTTEGNGRTNPFVFWTIGAIAANPQYSKPERRLAFNNDPVLASEVVDNQTLLSLKFPSSKLISSGLIKRLELSDLLTAAEEMPLEYDADGSAPFGSRVSRLMYNLPQDRINFVQAKYQTMSLDVAGKIAGLTYAPDIVDAEYSYKNPEMN